MIKSARNHLRVASKWAYEEEDVDSVNFLMDILDDYERMRGMVLCKYCKCGAPVCAPELEIDVDVSLVTSDSQKIPLVRITGDTLAIHSISALVAKAHQFDKHGPALVRLAMAADAIRDLVRNDK